MAKQKKIQRLVGTQPPGARGRTAKTTAPDASVPNPREGNVLQERLTEASRPISSGGGKMRGDRRDTNSYYTGNAKHKARGNNPRRDVSTRKR